MSSPTDLAEIAVALQWFDWMPPHVTTESHFFSNASANRNSSFLTYKCDEINNNGKLGSSDSSGSSEKTRQGEPQTGASTISFVACISTRLQNMLVIVTVYLTLFPDKTLPVKSSLFNDTLKSGGTPVNGQSSIGVPL